MEGSGCDSVGVRVLMSVFSLSHLGFFYGVGGDGGIIVGGSLGATFLHVFRWECG